MLGLAKRLKCKIFQASTSEIYGDPDPPFSVNGSVFGFRVGDNAPMALVELVDRPEVAAEPEAAPKTA
jgi:GDP-D-mannose dehydratase